MLQQNNRASMGLACSHRMPLKCDDVPALEEPHGKVGTETVGPQRYNHDWVRLVFAKHRWLAFAMFDVGAEIQTRWDYARQS